MKEALLRIFPQLNYGAAEISIVLSRLSIKKFVRNEIILKKGEVARNLYIIKSGLIRGFAEQKNGKEKTIWVFKQGEVCTDVPSFSTLQPSQVNVQALSATTTFCISYEDMQYLYKKIPCFNIFVRQLLEENLRRVIEDLYTLVIIECPFERYLRFRRLHENILDQIPQHFIADLINVSPVHLSRIKSQFVEEISGRR